MKIKSKQGGKRKGAGRPKLKNPRTIKLSVSFSEQIFQELKKIHPRYGELSKVASILLEEYLVSQMLKNLKKQK